MLHFEGERDFPQPPSDVWNKLSDARFLVQCVPGVETVAHSDATKAQCVLRPGFAFVRGTLELTVDLVEITPGSAEKILLHTKGIGSSADVETNLFLTPEGAGTRLAWNVEVKALGGLLKAIPQGLIKAAAQ